MTGRDHGPRHVAPGHRARRSSPPRRIAEVELRLQLVRDAGFRLDVELALPGRGVTGVLGPSGCGKSTLLRAVAGLEAGARGRISVAGEVWQDDAAGLRRPTHRRAVGMVFQEPSLFAHLSVEGNLDYGRRRLPAEARTVDRDGVIDLLGLGGLLGRRPETLSGGERQRVAVGRALLSAPRLLLLDEPLSAVDEEAKGEILPYLDALRRELEMPVLYVSHDLGEVARLADHLVLMEVGRAAGEGPLAEVLTRLDLPLAARPDAEAVVDGRVAGHDDRYHLTRVEVGGVELTLPREELAAGERVRLRVQARDVSLGLEMPAASSILNLLPARVLELADTAPGQVTVRLAVGEGVLLARITRRSADQLALEPGREVVAQVKSVALL